MHNPSKNHTVITPVIHYLREMANTLPNVEDILVRGSMALGYEHFVEGYSDIDTTMIVSTCNATTLQDVRHIKAHVKHLFPYKFSITVVTTTDFLHALHHHGHKPIFYSYTLSDALSLLNKKWPVGNHQIDKTLQRFDACSNIAFLIYEMRNKLIASDPTNTQEMGTLCLDFFKKSTHLIRNMAFCLTGSHEKKLDFHRLSQLFSALEPDYIVFMNRPPHELDLLSLCPKDIDRIVHCVNYMLSQAEKLYQDYLTQLTVSEFMRKNVT